MEQMLHRSLIICMMLHMSIIALALVKKLEKTVGA
jgi:hypothetical protein